jgi:hypothetical protein
MARASRIEPIVGDWYSSQGDLFEVVAVDHDESLIEVQHADGTVAEIDADEWSHRAKTGDLRLADQPEDVSGAIDVDEEPARQDGGRYDRSRHDDEASLRASGLDGLDLFE